MNYKSSNYFLFFTLLQFKICFVAAWYGQDAHTSYFLAFYFFTFLLFSVPLQCLGGMGFPARITQQGYGKNAIASY